MVLIFLKIRLQLTKLSNLFHVCACRLGLPQSKLVQLISFFQPKCMTLHLTLLNFFHWHWLSGTLFPSLSAPTHPPIPECKC